MKRSRQRIEVNLPELDAVLERALQEPLTGIGANTPAISL